MKFTYISFSLYETDFVNTLKYVAHVYVFKDVGLCGGILISVGINNIVLSYECNAPILVHML